MMREKTIRRLERTGHTVKFHEENLSNKPQTEGIMKGLPGRIRANGYLLNFEKQLLGGFEISIETQGGRHVATVGIRRWSSREVKDMKTGNRIILNLSLLSARNLEVTVIEKCNF